ncbi:uncharacterized protein LOC125872512 [Solanum stenotomum]|uniref:uncharacterized protein LOC125872512 n=1 Tax=Solanum stenotomum TaxID=172797 RepID=UPI0020D18F21|nr:uncharacterized protein LOC125872512 [Solanum stenotomum]
MGLNDYYCAPRGNILMISSLPSIPNVYALLMQEEKQREVQNTPKFPGESSSFIADNGQRSFSTDFRGQKGNYDSKKSNLVCRYCKKTGHSIEKCYKIHRFPADFKFTKSRNFQNSVKSNAVTSNEFSGDCFMTSAESEEHEKLLTQVQLAQVMQMLQQVKNKDQANNSDVIASVNCADFFINLKPLPRIISVRLPNSQKIKGPSMKSPMLLGESQNGLYILKNRLPIH